MMAHHDIKLMYFMECCNRERELAITTGKAQELMQQEVQPGQCQ